MPQPPIPRSRGSIRRVLLAAAALAIAGSGVGPVGGRSTARAAAVIPDEPGAFRIDGPSFAALVADLDGDGVRELVRITNWSKDSGRMAVEIWRQASDGRWSNTGPAVELRRGRSVNERLEGISADAENMRPVLTSDAARLLVWRVGGRQHVLALVNSSRSAGDEPPCCLTVWEVTAAPQSKDPVLRRLIDTQQGGDLAYALDMDADGTDELAIHQPPAGGGGFGSIIVLRWLGGRFRVVKMPINVGTELRTYRLGDSDGLPGEEIGMVGVFGEGAGIGLTRLSLREGAIHVEVQEMASDGTPLTVPHGGAGAGQILYGDVTRSITAFSWPADAEMRTMAESTMRGRPIGVIGSGASSRILVLRQDPPALDLVAPDLSEASVEGIRPADAAKPYFATMFAPYVGPWPDASGGVSAQVFAGTRVSLTGGDQVPVFTPMAVLPGMAPLGSLGRDGAWTALAQRTVPGPRTAPSATAADVEWRGGSLLSEESFSITVVRSSDVLAPEQAMGVIHPDLVDAALDPSDTTHETILTGTARFQAILSAPVDSVTHTEQSGGNESHLLVRTPDQGDVAILGPPFSVPIPSSPASSGNQAYDATLWVITPAGHGYTARWHVRLLRVAPALTAEAPFLSLGFAATVSGRTDPAATVTVEGRTTRPDRDGRFRVTVPAGFVPRDVRVVARDPIGNVAIVTASVVAPLDYRRLPWIPIMVVLTLAAAALLFLRSPRPAPRPRGGGSDDGSFEEIDAD